MMRSSSAPGFVLSLLGLLIACPLSRAQEPNAQDPNHQRQPMVYEGSPGGLRILEEGQPPAMIHATLDDMMRFREANPHARPHAGGTPTNLSYHGGAVETAPKVYLVLWGSQWNGNDPSGESGILQSFYQGALSASPWLNSVTQYCQGVPTGTTNCAGLGGQAANSNGVLAGVWADNATAAPRSPRQSQFAAEAVRAAQHFGNSAAINANAQYVIATATGNNSKGFKTQFCAYHSATSSTVGNVAYTNLPYITDAGASCGANFNGLGADAGITIVAGHEMAETITDQFPNSGWVDSSGAENGDKCAWIPTGNQGAAADAPFSTGTFPVQSLWSNAFNGGSGGCVLSYP